MRDERVIPGRALARTSDAQLRIKDLEIPGLVLAHHPGMTINQYVEKTQRLLRRRTTMSMREIS
jgi:hypothetical protein